MMTVVTFVRVIKRVYCGHRQFGHARHMAGGFVSLFVSHAAACHVCLVRLTG